MSISDFGPGVAGTAPDTAFRIDRAPVATVMVGKRTVASVSEFSYDSDVLQLGDPIAVKIADPDLVASNAINEGDPIKFLLADPDVQGGSTVQKLVGLVTAIDAVDDPTAGTYAVITGADLGWHLVNNSGPLFFSLRGRSFQDLLNRVIDPSWGFAGVRSSN